MSNYDEMHDHTINMAVTSVVHKLEGWEVSASSMSFYHYGIDGSGFFEVEVIDYCNNPSDAWFIIVDNKINIEWRDSLKLNPLAKGTAGSESWHTDKNPLRAAMICFLKMKDTRQ